MVEQVEATRFTKCEQVLLEQTRLARLDLVGGEHVELVKHLGVLLVRELQNRLHTAGEHPQALVLRLKGRGRRKGKRCQSLIRLRVEQIKFGGVGVFCRRVRFSSGRRAA